MAKLYENLWVRIASVILAFLLWFHVVTDKVYQKDIYLPLKVIDITGDLELVDPPPDSIGVTVSATGKRLLRTDWKKRGLKLLLNRGRPGHFRTELGTDNVSLVGAENVDLISILDPREVTLNCDTKISRELPVVSRVAINPDEGFIVSTVDSIVPTTIIATGPNKSLAMLNNVETISKTFDNVRNNFDRKVALKMPDMYGIHFEPDSVVAYIEVMPIKRKTLSDVEIRLINVPPLEKYTFKPQTIELSISGTSEIIDSIRADQISVIADFALRDTTGKIPLNIVLPAKATLVSKSNESIIVSKIK
ncbi:MAG: hypothetical protein ABIJ45_11895 [Candidatus Zixiibacteriota bacterium]